jgi:hypothetical protein
MDKELFNDLLSSIKEAGAILRGEKPASRIFYTDDDRRADTDKTSKHTARFIIPVSEIKNYRS